MTDLVNMTYSIDQVKTTANLHGNLNQRLSQRLMQQFAC